MGAAIAPPLVSRWGMEAGLLLGFPENVIEPQWFDRHGQRPTGIQPIPGLYSRTDDRVEPMPVGSDPELPIYARAARGEPVLGELVAEHLPRLRAFVRAHMDPGLRRRESESDLVQTVCRALLEGREKFDFRGEPQFRAWLFTAARNKILQKQRFHLREQRDLRREAARTDADLLLQGYQTLCTPSQVVAAEEQIAQLEAALDSLDEEHREVITLSRFAQLPFEEVGQRMGRSADAARKLLGRALVKLTERLQRGEP